ncbi:MAG TPA: radical SAM protein, partial [Saprospiraceae bacterium]|nr:radical SAM protein [Saprospiraceae bacterium]
MEKLIDNHGRSIEYIRIAVTDRCNLRCYYCMPEEGIEYVPREHLLHYEEIERLVRVLAQMGVRKVRFTGGEPFIRRDVIHLMESIAAIPGIEALHITTNGTVTRPFIPQLTNLGVKGINLSLDTLSHRLDVKLVPRNGGIGKTSIFINGKEIIPDANPPRGFNRQRDTA